MSATLGAAPTTSAAQAVDHPAERHTAMGAACTIVGTRGNDVLRGTPHRDVICGLAGDDRIVGRGGNDLIAGGAGDDTLQGGAGHDQLAGGEGDDHVSGGAGNDVQTGGEGNDLLRGAGGNDVLTGVGGDDDLGGGAGADDVDGGAGFNVCDEPGDPGDQQTRCVVDATAPEADDLSAEPSTVDVSDDSQTVRLEAHVTDDTGVKAVHLGTSATLVSGTTRDGVWASTIRVPRYLTPGPHAVDVDLQDRVGRWTSTTIDDAYTVIDTHADTQMPVLQSISLDRTDVDVRAAAQTITASVHITDDLAGAADMYLCPAHAFPTGTPSFRQSGGCAGMFRTTGDATDSTWTGRLEIPKGAPSGTWNMSVWIDDAAGNSANDFWFGPDELASIGPTMEPRYKAIPDGGGVFTVQGVPQDLDPPVLTSVTFSQSTIDTSNGAVRVTADLAGTDLQGITGAYVFIAGYPGYPDHPDYTDSLDLGLIQDFELVNGTPQDGDWRATFVVPGGTPDGQYFIQATLEDSSHYESWVSPDSGWTTTNHLLTPDLAPGGVLFTVANS